MSATAVISDPCEALEPGIISQMALLTGKDNGEVYIAPKFDKSKWPINQGTTFEAAIFPDVKQGGTTETDCSDFYQPSDLSEPDWLKSSKQGLMKIRSLPDNWDGYGSPPLDHQIYREALEYLEALEYEDDEKIPTPYVVPVSGGGVQFEWQYMDRELEIELSQAGKIIYLKVFENGSMEEGEISPSDSSMARELINWLISSDH